LILILIHLLEDWMNFFKVGCPYSCPRSFSNISTILLFRQPSIKG
jgi:hypothetical protein